MIANANNCESISNFMLFVRKEFDRDDLDDLSRLSQQQLDRYESMGKKFERTADLPFYVWHKRILAHYLRNLFSRTTPIKFSTPAERCSCAGKLCKEAFMLDKEFKSWDGTSTDNATEYHFNILSNIADVVEQTDLDLIVLEIATLAKKYPNLSTNQVIQILLLREDLTKQEASDTADAAVAYMPRVNQGILFEIMEIVNQPN
ncbi:unnamed protein product [Rotaria sp. Silwood2]|nr:unnamed protein product [Rotaria sp. Silwood2]CAF4218920.1 unnamed protein product [Rotaria sp. Silwood2]